MRNAWSWYFAFFGIHYLPFVIPALAVFVGRLALRQVTRRELALFGLTLLLIALEAIQLGITDTDLVYGHSDFIPTWERYFGVLAPFIWIWTACGLVQLMRLTGRGPWFLKPLAVLLSAGALGFVFVVQNVRERYKEVTVGAGKDAMVAGERASRIIARDYRGPRRFPEFPYSLADYYTSRRPVVVSFWGCAAWACRGQSQGVGPGYPFREDYYLVRVDSRYRKWLGAELARSREHDFLCEVMGVNYRWRLYKRKGCELDVRGKLGVQVR